MSRIPRRQEKEGKEFPIHTRRVHTCDSRGRVHYASASCFRRNMLYGRPQPVATSPSGPMPPSHLAIAGLQGVLSDLIFQPESVTERYPPCRIHATSPEGTRNEWQCHESSYHHAAPALPPISAALIGQPKLQTVIFSRDMFSNFQRSSGSHQGEILLKPAPSSIFNSPTPPTTFLRPLLYAPFSSTVHRDRRD